MSNLTRTGIKELDDIVFTLNKSVCEQYDENYIKPNKKSNVDSKTIQFRYKLKELLNALECSILNNDKQREYLISLALWYCADELKNYIEEINEKSDLTKI
jgi:hypothetical protein